MIHVFVLILTIGGGEPSSEDCREAMCFYDLNRCNYFVNRLSRGNSPSTLQISAYCKPVLVDRNQENIRIY
tara:strand:+ start:387 stop:599 length:213 start_codon:yes stop_codon:yes gene_type:complete